MLDARLKEALSLPDEQGPMGRALAALLDDAAKAGVSDVHLNPTPAGLEVLYRLDGVLHPRAKVDAARSEQFMGKVKVLAGLLTYRRDVPQDGQIPAADAGGLSDVRVSIVPTVNGEKAVLRFFLHSEAKFDLASLALPAPIEAALRAAAAKPDGVILLTGPAGSGKTSTIYALLREIVRPGRSGPLRHAVTIEDPVEHALEGVTQTQVNPAAGLGFSASLRALLRQDPQVILVGEIRDRETARVAMEAGLTGHLVISTVHAGSAAGVVSRLLEMGVEPHVLTASLRLVLAQRLARRKCPDCAAGCPACQGSGFQGRRVIGELLEVDDALRAALLDRPSRARIEELAVKAGMVPLAEAGRAVVRDGITTEEEVRRVLG
jgi:general secretion pathway protein E